MIYKIDRTIAVFIEKKGAAYHDNTQRYNIFRNSFLNVNGMKVSQAGHLCMEDRVRGCYTGSDPDIFNI